MQERPRLSLDLEMLSADLAHVVVGRRQPLLDTAPVDEADGPGTLAGRDEPLETFSVMAYSAESSTRVLGVRRPCPSEKGVKTQCTMMFLAR